MSKVGKTFQSFNYGCRVNEAERQELDRRLTEAGLRLDPSNPDLYVINSCAVTSKAEREARQLIYRLRRENSKAKIVVTGCAATYWQKNGLYKNLPIDLAVDNMNKEFLAKIIENRLLPGPILHRVGVNGISDKFIGSGRALIKIQDGCQRFCTFCIIPYLRGLPSSERIKNLEFKIKNLGPKIKEVILTAINTEAFGYDTGEKFVNLLKAVTNETDVSRISCGSIHPWSITDEFLRFYKEYLPKKRLVNFFHIPLQSGSNKILNLMKRGYMTEEFMTKLKRLQEINPFSFLSTDIIVGFLDEEDDDFADTYKFLHDSPISRFHVFRFSKRSKTAADYLAKRLKEPTSAEKIKRARALSELSAKKYHHFLQKNVGRTSTVLLLKKTVNGFREGLLDNQLPIYISTVRTTASVTKVAKVIELKKGRLFGKIV